MGKIQSVISICYHIEAIQSTLDTLFRQPELAENINIIENPSPTTEIGIKPLMLKLLKEKRIKRYFLTDRNITHNATKKILLDNHINITETPHILITNGNTSCKVNDDTWLNKQLKLIEDPHTYTVAVPISLENMPEGQERCLLPMHHIHQDFDIGFTGKHYLLFKSDVFKRAMDHVANTNAPFIDSTLHNHCRMDGKRWLVIKEPHFYRHTWDLFKLRPHDPYMQVKSKHFNMLWRHEEYCGYTIYNQDGTTEKIEVDDKKGYIFE